MGVLPPRGADMPQAVRAAVGAGSYAIHLVSHPRPQCCVDGRRAWGWEDPVATLHWWRRHESLASRPCPVSARVAGSTHIPGSCAACPTPRRERTGVVHLDTGGGVTNGTGKPWSGYTISRIINNPPTSARSTTGMCTSTTPTRSYCRRCTTSTPWPMTCSPKPSPPPRSISRHSRNGRPSSTRSQQRSPPLRRRSGGITTRSKTAPWTTTPPAPVSGKSNAPCNSSKPTATNWPTDLPANRRRHRPPPCTPSATTSATSWPRAARRTQTRHRGPHRRSQDQK
jgi:hypothetical protein